MSIRLFLLLLVFCFCLVGFMVSGGNQNIYLQSDEAIYVSHWGEELVVYVYKYDSDSCTYTGQWIDRFYDTQNTITIHFPEESKTTYITGGKNHGMAKSK